ncbi:MAG TPA: lamin tail domain-containing protein [Acidimicrobiia bacterium]|nr:lamin tail domain-containing protein [Acidimicrobiia bacterium]
MGTLLGLLGLAGLVFGLINLVRPMGRLGISTRKGAGSLVFASFGMFILAAAVNPSPDPDAVGDSTPITAADAGKESTTTISSVPVVSVGPPATSGPATTVGTDLGVDPVYGLPTAGPSGDPSAPLPASAERATVLSITDGDTIDVVLADGSRDTVRLIGVNAPERAECWASEATMVLEALVPAGSEIGMTFDQSDRDRFDRLLRYLWVGSMSVNQELVRRGAAISRRYPPDTGMAARLDGAQDGARADGLGIWAPDACGTASGADLRIIELRYDAEGNDNENLNDEWIKIRNQGDTYVDLTRWGVKDESATNRYTFPSGFSLAPGEVVTVYSGCGDDFDTALYWCSVGSAIWNNDGDTAFLTDPVGNTHYSWSYSG